MSRKKLSLLICLPLLPLLVSCFRGKEVENPNNSQRVNVAREGILIDAKYDPRLDNLVPGYKILTVGLTNNGYDTLRLNPLTDKWEIVDAVGKTRRGIPSLRIKDPARFSTLPSKMQQMLEYPVGISVGYSETIDLFFPSHVAIDSFRSISFYSGERKKTFDVMSEIDNPNQIPINPTAESPDADAATVKKGKKLRRSH